MADDLSLLFRLKADNAQAKAVLADTRQAVAQLRQSFGPQLTQSVTVANKAFSEISDNLNVFVGQRLPLVGGAFVRITENLRNLGSEGIKGEKAIAGVAKSIESIASQSGKSTSQIASFLTKFVQIEGQANRDKSAIDFFGASLAQNLIPELEKTGEEMAGVASESVAAGSSIAGIAGPISIAVVALAALAAGAVVAAKEIFALSKSAAEFQGKLFDLSQQTGVSVETLSALEVEARTTGSSIEALTQSLGIFQKNLEEAQDESSKAGKVFKELGVETNNTEEALRQTIAALAKMPQGFKQTSLALDVFGRGGKAFLAIAKETNGDIDELTRRFGKFGLVSAEQAKIADEFNDQLVLLDVQLRGLGTQAIPVVLDALKGFSKFLEENREAFVVLQGAVKGLALSITVPLKFAIVNLNAIWKVHMIVIEGIAKTYQAIANSLGFIIRHPIPAPPNVSAAAAPQGEAFTKELRDEIAARERLQAVLSVDFAKQQQQARDALAKSQRDLDAGKINRAQALEQSIAATKKEIKAQIDALEVDRKIKLEKEALAKDDLEKQQQFSNQVLAIDAQIVEKRATLARTEADLRARARLDDQKDELAHQQAQLDTLTKIGSDKITVIEDLIRQEKVDRETGLKEIEDIENAALQARGQLLKKELALAGVGPTRQAVLDKIKALEADRTAVERQQSERRIQLSREEFEQKRQILLSGIDALLQIEQIRGEAQITRIETQAALRIKTEEQAAKEILAIRLKLLDSQIEATQAKEKAAAGIIDPQERRQTQAQLANDLKILNAERTAIQEEGNRNIDEARKKDVANADRYAKDLEKIDARILDVQRDVAQEVIRLMIAHFARRKDIIRAQVQADIDDENSRHRQALETIRNLESENRQSNKTQAEKLEEERQLNQLREAEAERHRLVMQGIKDQGKKAEEEADPLGRIDLDIENLKEFSRIIEDTIVPLGEILRNTFLQVADAIGQTVQNWVLLGETGPAVMRKILAQALASVAAEAAVNAIKELALGFATLFFNPAESAAHFTAAGLWASIGVGSALAGRAIAGDLFKAKSAGAGGGSGTTGNGELNPLNLARNAGPGAPQQIAPQIQPIRLILEHRVDDSKFGKAITTHVVDDINNAGPIREVIAGDGNLNRG